MKKSRIIATLGLAALVGCVPGGVHPQNEKISGLTAQALLDQARPVAKTSQSVTVGGQPGQVSQGIHTTLINLDTGDVAGVYPQTEEGMQIMTEYLKSQADNGKFPTRGYRNIRADPSGRILFTCRWLYDPKASWVDSYPDDSK